MSYKIVTASSASGLNNQIGALIKEGWQRKGSHKVVTTHKQNRFRGNQLVDTVYTQEFSQTMIKE